ncbi:unnamed protein product [Lampetra planeri]
MAYLESVGQSSNSYHLSGNGPTTRAPSFAAGNREAWVSAFIPSDDDEDEDDEVGKRGDSTPATVVGEERRA